MHFFDIKNAFIVVGVKMVKLRNAKYQTVEQLLWEWIPPLYAYPTHLQKILLLDVPLIQWLLWHLPPLWHPLYQPQPAHPVSASLWSYNEGVLATGINMCTHKTKGFVCHVLNNKVCITKAWSGYVSEHSIPLLGNTFLMTRCQSNRSAVEMRNKVVFNFIRWVISQLDCFV